MMVKTALPNEFHLRAGRLTKIYMTGCFRHFMGSSWVQGLLSVKELWVYLVEFSEGNLVQLG